MADIEKLTIDGETYDIADAAAQEAADKAQSTANSASSAASAAQTTADSAASAASAAQSTADSAKSGLTDGSVTKVGTATVGAANAPIYLRNGVPTAGYSISGMISSGSDVELVNNERTGQDFTLVYPYFYGNGDTGTAYYSTQFKLQDGLLSIEDGATVGSGTTPVYLNSGTITASPYPYYLTAGDTFTVNFYGAGYVTTSSSQINFIIPLSVPLRGYSSIAATSQGTFILRQGGYTHGSSSDSGVAPSSISYAYTYPGGLRVQATFSSTSGATNNAAIGIYMANTTIALS